MNTLVIYRNSNIIATVNIDEKTVLVKKLMSDHKIKSEFITNSETGLQIGDYITFNSENYYLNRIPEGQKINNSTFKYICEFEADVYSLHKKQFMYDGLAEFSYTGNPLDFIVLIVGQINQIDTGWSTGDVDTADEIRIDFSNQKCRQALTHIAEKFGFEFQIINKTIHFKKTVGNATSHRFEYGRGKGLYSLTRLQISDQNIVTRVHGFGGSRNISADYRNRAKKLVFASRYLEANIGLYGVIEGEFTDEKIYPRRTGSITVVNSEVDSNDNWNTSTAYVEDSTLDFDINDYLVSGETAKIVFKSGDLSGYEFEIWKYNHTQKRIYFNPFTETDGYTLPNLLNLPAVDDTYTLIGISMPQSYIDAAEAELQAATQAYLDQNSVPKATYKLDIDPRYIKANGISLDTGDLVNAVDPDFGIDADIRVMDLEFPLVNPNKVKATISDTIVYNMTERLIKTAVQNKQEITNVKAGANELVRTTSLLQNYIAATCFRGDFDVEATYEGTKRKLDVVKYGGAYYVAKVDAGNFVGILPTDGAKWNSIGSSFESIATGLLLAELAYIENLGVRYLKTGDNGQRIEINGDTGALEFYDASDELIMSLATGSVTANNIKLSGNVSEGIRQIDLDYTGQSGLKENYLTVADFNVYYRIAGTPSASIPFKCYLPLNPDDGKTIGVLFDNVSDSGLYSFSIVAQTGDSIFPKHETSTNQILVSDSFYLKLRFKKSSRRWIIEGNAGITAGVTFYDRDNNLINMQFRQGSLVIYSKTPT